MQTTRLQEWWNQFLTKTQEPVLAEKLKQASMNEKLGDWTQLTTNAVARACEGVGWDVATRGNRGSRLPESASEYLALDGMAFPNRNVTDARWPMPVAVFELENSKRDDRVGYSLWKVLCIRAPVRFVFAYRRDWDRTRLLIERLTEDVIGSFSPEERLAISGETAVVTGSRGESETFPHGYFKLWLLDTNLGKFNRI